MQHASPNQNGDPERQEVEAVVRIMVEAVSFRVAVEQHQKEIEEMENQQKRYWDIQAAKIESSRPSAKSSTPRSKSTSMDHKKGIRTYSRSSGKTEQAVNKSERTIMQHKLEQLAQLHRETRRQEKIREMTQKKLLLQRPTKSWSKT